MPESTPSSPAADRNLLFGVLALQMDFIDRDALIKAMNAWVLEKRKPLGQILVEQHALGDDEHALLEALVQKHLQRHSNDPEKSLAAVGSLGALRGALELVGDADLLDSLVHVPARPDEADPSATCDFAVGTATSAGQRFRVLRPHARGGLGEVFVARDEELDREVALKEIQQEHADRPEHRSRFLLEAKVTGGLEHPGIVPVYGLGAYPDGRPFYAMRLIKGDSLKEAISSFHKADVPGRDVGERTLALRGLLGRFVGVCNAIAYAHSRGVLHRDLKPANVMLGPYGETLVVDWGLAKTVGRAEGISTTAEETLRPSSADGVTPTVLGQAVGTPAYMSPEQAAGRLDKMGPESDIYSLGATLYCLLTGRAPFEGASAGEVLRQVQKGSFPPPRQVKPSVPAALEAVCLKAMALEAEDRYSSARALADDIEHYLADEPVAAYREPWRVRSGRWVRRHKTAVAAATAATLAAVVLGGWGVWRLEQQAARQRQGVETALAEVARLQGQARWAEARVALDQANNQLGPQGAEYLRMRLEQARRDLDLVARLDAIRLNRADTLGEVGKTARDYEEAFREAGMVAVDGDAAAAAAWVSSVAVREALVAALDDWALCAQSRQRRAWVLEVARRADPDPWRDRVRDPAVLSDPAAVAQLAADKQAAGQSPQLLALLGPWLKGSEKERLLRAAQEQHPGDFWSNFWWGSALEMSKRPAEAVGYFRAALAVRPGTAAVYNNLGIALQDQGKLDEAAAEFRKAIYLDPKHALPHNNLGIVLRDQGKLDEAAAEYRKAIDLNPKYSLSHNNLGIVLRDQGKLDEAAAEFRKAIDLNPEELSFLANLYEVLRRQGKLDEAIAEYRKAINLNPKRALIHADFGIVLQDQGKLEEAIAEYRKAIELGPKLALPHYNLGNVLFDQGKRDEAAAEYRKAIDLDPKLAAPHNNLGNALKDQGKLDEAVAEYRKAIDLNPKSAAAHTNLGNILRDQGKLETAATEYRKAIALPPDTPRVRQDALQELRKCEEMLALDKKLAAILKGEARPADAAEQLGLARLCYCKKRYATAVRFFADALAAQPKLADDLDDGVTYRYHAASSAALAGAGQGQDTAGLDDKQRARLRQQALGWLHADLDSWAKEMQKGAARTQAAVNQLRHWQVDSDVASLRDAAALEKLPEAERAECKKLWAEVAALLKKAVENGKK
jgi:serine/threonine-protein kinase